MEYIVKVKSGEYDVPTVGRKRNPSELKHAKISDHDITIGFRDLLSTSWIWQLQSEFASFLSSNSSDSQAFNKTVREYVDQVHGIPIFALGFTCEKCLCIGITFDHRDVLSRTPNHHKCDLRQIVNAATAFGDEDRNDFAERLKQELPILLSTIISALRQTRRFVLLARPTNENLGNTIGIDFKNAPWVREVFLHGSCSLADSQADQLFSLSATAGNFSTTIEGKLEKRFLLLALC